MRALFEWLGEPWDEDLMSKARATRVSSHPNVSGPVSGRSVGRWRQDLPREARTLFRGSASALLVELGYASDDAWIEET